MGIGYGSRFDLPSLSSSEVGILKTSSSSSRIGILRILLGIAEIGTFLIPGLGEAVGVIGSTGIGIGFGAANEALDIKSGNVNAVGAFINFGAPIAGGLFTGARNIAKVGGVVEGGVGGINKATTIASENFLTGVRSYEQIGVTNFLKQTGRSTLEVPTQSFTKLNAFNKGLAGANKAIGRDGIGSFFTANKFANTGTRVAQEATDFIGEETRDRLKSLGFTDKEIIRLINKSSVFTNSSTENLIVLRNELRDIAKLSTNREVKRFANQFEKGLSKLGQLQDNVPQSAIIYRAFNDAIPEFGTKLLNERNNPWYKRVWKYIGTSNFNDKFVQRLQLVDPNDLGRAGVEKIYKVFKNKFGKYISGVEESLKDFGKLETAFERSGGTLLNSSWVLGYKVVLEELGRALILISFKPGPSYNKKPVLVWATKRQLKRFVTDSPGRTYQKQWAVSNGGSSIGLSGIFGGGPLKAFSKMVLPSVFGYIKTSQLRNMLSIISNWVENGSSIVKGTYKSTYKSKFLGSLTRSSISRTFRLGGKVVLGGVATKYLGASIGRLIGAESQRIGTQIIALGIKNTIAGKSFGTGLAKSAQTAALTSIKSNSLRTYRRNNGSTTLSNTLSAQRKVGYVRRIPNAIVAGRPFKGIKL